LKANLRPSVETVK